MILLFFQSRKQQSELPDADLVRLYKEEEKDVYVAYLFERYALQIYGICRKYFHEMEAEDMSMEIYPKLLVDLKKYEIQTFRNWLARTVKNHCLMALRKSKGHSVDLEQVEKSEEALMELENFLHPNEKEEKEKQLLAMENAMTGLKPEQKVCLELFYLKQLSYDAVSQKTGYSLQKVKSYIQNGKRNLRIKMENNEKGR